MMTRLMTWFIELQNRFNELKLFKTLTIYVLNWINDKNNHNTCKANFWKEQYNQSRMNLKDE